MSLSWKRIELFCLTIYALIFYLYIVHRSLQLSGDHHSYMHGLRPGWISNRLNDVSDPQWRNFRGNLPVLTISFGGFTLFVHSARSLFRLKERGVCNLWITVSLIYLSYLHGTCIIFILSIAGVNFLLVMILRRTKFSLPALWFFNILMLVSSRVFEGYRFSSIGEKWAYLDDYRGTFRWHICFNFTILRMISYGYDSQKQRNTDTIDSNRFFCFGFYLCYLLYAPLYIAGPIISFDSFVSQLVSSRISYHPCGRVVFVYGLRWVCDFLLMEMITHYLYYNAFMISALWETMSPMDVFIVGYGVLNFMWLKFLLIWRYFRFWSLMNGVEPVENMPGCINNCCTLDGFWKIWHASFNRWLVSYVYIPLGGSERKALNVWVVFTFVALWHDLEWKLLSWAWITCLFFVPEIMLKASVEKMKSRRGGRKLWLDLVARELNAVAGAVTISCLMVANLIGYVVGPSRIKYLLHRFLDSHGRLVLLFLFFSFYVAAKLMLHVGGK